MRLIDADALVENIESEIDKENKVPLDDDRKYFYCAGMRNVIRLVKRLPTIDPVKHGHWIFVEDMVSYIKCSECGDDICWVNTKRPKYCPNCGARMDGDTK
ncbi:MAG: hypothetical protein ACI3WT_07925 [Phascolarctobacterium sp.]